MIKNRVTVVSIIIIIIAVAVYFFSSDQRQEKQSSSFYGFIEPASIKQIKIEKGKKAVSLNCRDRRWLITDNNSLEIAVDTGKILPVFEFITDSSIVQKITQKKSSYPRFDITEDKAVKLVLQGRDKKDHIFYVGKEKDYASQFVRKAGDPYVYMVSKKMNLSLDKEAWFYKKVLEYDPGALDYIAYTCQKGKILKISYDKTADKLIIKEPPPGKEAQDLKKTREGFSKISVSKYLPRSEKIESLPVNDHTLYFKAGETVRLAFLKSAEEKSNKHYLDIKVDLKEGRDKDLKYLKQISDHYLFSLSWFDKQKYQGDYDEFFEDKPAEEAKELQPSDNNTAGEKEVIR